MCEILLLGSRAKLEPRSELLLVIMSTLILDSLETLDKEKKRLHGLKSFWSIVA